GLRLPPTTSTSTANDPHASPSDQHVRRWRSFREVLIRCPMLSINLKTLPRLDERDRLTRDRRAGALRQYR
ncbi:hypothetical protein ACIG5E_35545, partial [Kitasatospora sp. NPDC053057]|uniref:hypothetical protein n=1 Tax=Kitasatospora sp. NPDC053057 TaxID=3364062 RepID=UPI0037CAB3FC